MLAVEDLDSEHVDGQALAAINHRHEVRRREVDDTGRVEAGIPVLQARKDLLTK